MTDNMAQKHEYDIGFAGILQRKLDGASVAIKNPELSESEREVHSLSPLDLGLAYIGKANSAALFAEIKITENGVPVASREQMEDYKSAKRYADASGRSVWNVIRPKQFANVGEYYFAFPGNVLKWSSGLGYDADAYHPIYAAEENPWFDIEKMVYTPDVNILPQVGYGPEGVRRQSMLSLMSNMLHFASGVGEVRTDFDACRVYVDMKPQDLKGSGFKSDIAAFVYDLGGIQAVTYRSANLLPLSEVLVPSVAHTWNTQEKFYNASDVCMRALITARNERAPITSAANECIAMFR